MKLKGQAAIVTGSTRGLGREMALALAREGRRVGQVVGLNGGAAAAGCYTMEVYKRSKR